MASVSEVFERIQSIHLNKQDLEGVSILGGEPFDQAEGLSELLCRIRSIKLSTMVYTGHVYESIRRQGSSAVQRLLTVTDVLVDGPFVNGQYSGELSWRGSRNQRLLCLSPRYTAAELEARYSDQGKAFSIKITSSGLVSLSGIQELEGARKLEASVAQSCSSQRTPL